MSSLKRSIPSLFHRRLLLLVVLMLGATGVLGAQLFRLTVIDGAHHRSEAEKALSTRKLVTTARGTVYDRKGRILAQDQACFDIAVEYEVISGHWAYVRARKAAYRDYRETWGRMSFDEREAKVASYRAAFDADLDRLWSTVAQVAGVEPTELERRRATVIRKIQAVRSDVWDRRIRRRAAERQGPVELRSRRVTVAEENEAHALLPAVSDAVAFRFRQMADRLPGVQVIPSRTRRYPLRRLEVEVDRSVMPSPLREPDSIVIDVDRLGGHLMGTVREVHAEHVTARPFRPASGQIDLGGYLPGDMAGRGGVEEAEEQHLRGWRGMRSIRLDTQEKTLAPPRQGRPMELSIDIHLQARIRALLDPKLGLTKVQEWHKNSHLPLGMPLNAAAVVMDVETAELLALVSTPVPPWPGPAAAGENPASDPDRPFVNRTIGSVYPPGSLLKPIVYCIAAQRGAIGSAQEVDCQGHLLPDHPGRYRCWGWRPQEGYFLRHGPLPPVEAIARSCNIFFYTCGRNLGAEALVADLGRWGLGTAVGLGLPGESRGMLPRLSGANRPGRELTLSNAT
ncbi:MAG: penicillin-binding transpeptidase domain-containing protein, partial [Phycisphaerae bacterium]|nr:penicillin-binding transpeptidase domain-containing protein [Phycisphaerae bacterium]